jgi:transportin-1
VIVERLVPILAAPMGTMPRSIMENSAITLGRVAWVAPEPIAPHLELFVGTWCQVCAITEIRILSLAAD